MRCTLYNADCRAVLPRLSSNSIHACVTDPPYELGFMGNQWDQTGIAYSVPLWRQVLRVLKPGGHLVAFGATRTYHRLACAIQDAGFEVRDSIHWGYETGFPQASREVGKAIDKLLGAERPALGTATRAGPPPQFMWGRQDGRSWTVTGPASDQARAWDGWGTGLRPAHEPAVLARKPLDGTIAENVLAHGAGAIDVDGCRDEQDRWPGNLWLLPCSKASRKEREAGCDQLPPGDRLTPMAGRGEGGLKCRSCGRWKNSGSPCCCTTPDFEQVPFNRPVLKNSHPSVKPLRLMRWLVRLVTPQGAIVLDPFAGSGTTGCAAVLEATSSILIEKQPDYVHIAKARVTHHGGQVHMPRFITVFYAHAAGAAPDAVERDRKTLAACIAARWSQMHPGEEALVTVRSGRDDFDSYHRVHPSRNGKPDWGSWIKNVVDGKNSTTGQPRYDLFMTRDMKLGKATMSIFRSAMSAGRIVFWWNGSSPDWPAGSPPVRLHRAAAVVCDDQDDWQTGWSLVLKEGKRSEAAPEPTP